MFLYLFGVFFFVLYILILNQESPIPVEAPRNVSFDSLERHAIDVSIDAMVKTSRSRRESCLASGYRTCTAYNFGTISLIPMATPDGFPLPPVASRLQWIGSPPYHVSTSSFSITLS